MRIILNLSQFRMIQQRMISILFIKFKFSIMKSLLLVCLIVITSSQVFNVYPDQSYAQVTASSRACFATCQFCQIKSGFCEQCLSPYFQKDSNGNCVVITGYTIESSLQQLSSDSGFMPSNVSWSNSKTTTCNPGQDYLQASLLVLGPFGTKDGTITYQRSVSSHKYMKLKFFIIKMDWNPKDQLSIVIQNQDNTILSNQTISYTEKTPKEILCSSTLLDQRFSVEYQFENVGTTSFFISFTPTFASTNTQWALSTYLLLTGNCNQTCDECYASSEATKCKSCRNFFIQGADGTCNQCADGFKKISVNGISKCQKCSIEYKSCEINNEVCFYNVLSSQLNSNCTWNAKKNYISTYYVNTDQFTGSLISVNGASSTYKCGDYSIVGLVNKGQSLTRIFTSLKAHQAISITFNFIIIDQTAPQKTIFEIYLDNVRVQTLFINTVGISDICGGNQKQVFQTYPATKFFSHNSTQNMNLTLRSSSTGDWGLRNLRVSYHVCDQSCLECGPDGCLTCNGIMSLDQLSCSSCPQGASMSGLDTSVCYQCTDNCLSCLVHKQNNEIQKTCTKCQQGFFLFEGRCQILPNVGQTVNQDSKQWKSNDKILADAQCSIQYRTNITTGNRKVNFLVAQNTLTNSYQITDPHYRMLVSFYLLKVDHWHPKDEINLYINDLLVLRKNYTDFGNRICFNQSENDIVTYQEVQVEDDNQTLTAYFEVVSASNTAKRKFGISNFNINPVACPECQHYDFHFKVEYNYDQVLTVQVIFNRLYVNNDPDLFKTIFKLQVNGKRLNYSLTRNDSIRYFLQAHPDAEVLLNNVTVYCKYPEKVTTDIYEPINEEVFFEARRLQEATISRLKSLQNSVSSKVVERFTPLESPNTANGIKIFFEVITRMVIYIGFFSFFIGCLTPCTHFMHNIQKLWLHIYVASLTIPNLLKYALKGFRQSQDQNIAIYPSSWQIGIPDYLYYEAPAQYQDYYHDITFFRNIYNVGFAAALYMVFALIMYLLFRSNKVGRSSNNKFIRHLKITFYRRPYFVFNSVIFYQYITVCIACTLQFIDLSSRTNQNPFRGINAAAAAIAFILATIYPLLHFFYLSYKQKDMYSIGYEISYRNRYHEIFYRFLPKNLWKIPNYEFAPLGFKQRFYNLLRFGQIWWFSIIFALMYGSPFAQTFLLIITNFLHLAFLWISSISSTTGFKILKVLELMFFVGLQTIILVAYQQNQTLTKDAYNALGVVGVVFIFMILLLSFIRFIYTLIKLIKEYRQNESKDDKNDERLRNDDFFASFDNNVEKISSEE